MIRKVRDTMAVVVEDALAIAQLNLEVGYHKLADYDRLARSVTGLRNVVATLERNADDLSAQIERRDKRIAKLENEYQALKAREGSDMQASASDQRLTLYKKVQPLATQLPTLRQSIEEGSEVSVDDVIALLAPLNEALADMGFEAIGKPGGETKFDPTHHRAVGKGARSVAPGDRVKVRYVGYRHEDKVVTKAQVTAIQ